MKSIRNTLKQQQGFTITQMVVTIAIMAVVSTFGVMGIKTARAEFQQQSAGRLFASYIEKARADAIRRHAADGEESSVETFGPGTTTYAVTMDWGSGALETRNFELEYGLTFDTDARKVAFNWRGRIDEHWVFQIKSDYLKKNLPVDVSGSGDITVDLQHFPDQSIPPVEVSEVTGDVATPTPTPTPEATATPTPTPTPTPESPGDATPTPTPEIIDSNPGNGGGGSGGNGNGDNGNGNPTPTPTPTSTPTPTPDGTMPQCASSISPDRLDLSQSDSTKKTGTATFTMVNATGVRIIEAAQAAHGNALVIGLSLVRIDGNGSSVISVTTKQGGGNRGAFVVEVSASPSCGSTQKLTVFVSN